MNVTRTTGILTGLLVLSATLNLFLIAVIIPSLQDSASRPADIQGTIIREDIQVPAEPGRVQGDGSTGILPSGDRASAPYVTGFSSLEAPVVTQRIVEESVRGYVVRSIVRNGSMTNVSVEIRPGGGRVLVQTMPLMGIVFQDAANTAVSVARNRTGTDLSESDIIFSIMAEHEVTEVDGPSAGALMTLITIAALENRTVNSTVTLSGTIDATGHVGAVGGILEKAAAAKERGKASIILPQQNNETVQFTERALDYGGLTIIQRVPRRIATRDYLENTIGIDVVFVETIDDVLAVGLES